MRIALVEDDPRQVRLLTAWLEDAGHNLQSFSRGKDLIKTLRHDSFDLLIIDWTLPDINGDKIVAWIRQNIDWSTPIIFVTGRDSEEDIIHGLKIGADDYMIKPVAHFELLARIEALTRRTSGTKTPDILQIGPYKLDFDQRTIYRNDNAVSLTEKEYQLAKFLFNNLGRIVSRDHLLENIWGKKSDINTRTVDTHISRVRKKLELEPGQGWRLSAIYQHGYRLEQLSD